MVFKKKEVVEEIEEEPKKVLPRFADTNVFIILKDMAFEEAMSSMSKQNILISSQSGVSIFSTVFRERLRYLQEAYTDGLLDINEAEEEIDDTPEGETLDE